MKKWDKEENRKDTRGTKGKHTVQRNKGKSEEGNGSK